MIKKVFISYSHDDNRVADSVAAFLATLPDQVHCFAFHRDQQPGDDFRKRILREIDQAVAVVVICSASSLKSEEVLFEVAYAIAKEVSVFPLSINRTEKPFPYLDRIQKYCFDGSNYDTLKLLKKELLIVQQKARAASPIRQRGIDSILRDFRELGMLQLGIRRTAEERVQARHEIINTVGVGTKLLLVGRTLEGWVDSRHELCALINEKKVTLKIGILNVFACDPRLMPDRNTNPSWIELPRNQDWDMVTAQNTYNLFKALDILPEGGSLEIFGLPFYVDHTVVCFSDSSKRTFCDILPLEDATHKSPFMRMKISSPNDGSLANRYKQWAESILSKDRLLFSNRSGRPQEFGVHNRAKSLVPKIERAGLVDISVGWKNIDWAETNIETLIQKLAPKSDLYMVGRTFMAWSIHARGFAKQVAIRSIRCKMVIANPKIPNLKSLVVDDQAQGELHAVYQTFERNLPIGFREAIHEGIPGGFIEIYGIPAYVPETFSLLTLDDGTEYCNLEAGIAVTPGERVPLFFKHVGDNDVYSSLRRIFENIVNHDTRHEVAKLLLRVDASSVRNQ